jgi:cell division protein FtsB
VSLDAHKTPSTESNTTELQKLQQTIKEKEREIKRLREELDRQHKVH